MANEHSKIERLKEQKEIVDKLKPTPVENSSWYIIDLRWWNKWNDYVEIAITEGSIEPAPAEYPGMLDNSNLMQNGEIKPDLLKEEDFTLVPEDIWKTFVSYYGCVHTDCSIFKRTAVKSVGGVMVEIYPPTFVFQCADTQSEVYRGTFSESQTIGELKQTVLKALRSPPDTTVQLFVPNETTCEALIDDTATIGEASLERQKVLYVRLESGSKASFNYDVSNDIPLPSSRLRALPGVCGLNNLGNTCFMNSAIQCISNVPELTAYFLSKSWKNDINVVNPLGTRGRLATAYAELIEHMWSGLHETGAPRNLKREIATIASQFHGYAQHDSHELLVFLLDGLHEDLNRVKKKPYIEVKDADGRPDDVVAAESWENYLARNNSTIIDLFHGQLKSTVICPTCKFRSIKFDPFASLNLPLPETFQYTKNVYVWPWVQSQEQTGPICVATTVSVSSIVDEILTSLRNARPPQEGCEYYLAEVYNGSLNTRSRNSQLCEYLRSRLFAYELPEGILIPVRLHDSNLYNVSGFVGIPFYISVPHANETSITESALVDLIAARLHALGVEVNSTSTTHSTAPEEPSDEHAKMNGDCDPLLRLLRGHIYLTDDRNQKLLKVNSDDPVNLQKYAKNTCRLTIECIDASLRSQLDDIMRSVSYQPSRQNTTSTNLASCFEKFVTQEMLGAQDLWYCSNCKKHKQATKKFDLWHLPKILVIQLKRFRSTLRSLVIIDSLVDYPTRELDVTQWVAKQTSERIVYDLIAVSNHTGNLGGGHYTASALNHPTQKWFHFNDAYTSETSESELVTRSAYVLIYRRRALQPDTNQSNISKLNNSMCVDSNCEQLAMADGVNTDNDLLSVA